MDQFLLKLQIDKIDKCVRETGREWSMVKYGDCRKFSDLFKDKL